MIDVINLNKDYKVNIQKRAIRGLLSGIFQPEYRIINAVKDISFKIESGSCVAFIGPNGAGKSTTIKIMTGVLHPTSGTVIINDIVPYQNRKKFAKQTGVVFGGKSQLWSNLPVIDSFELQRSIYQIPKSYYDENLKKFTEVLDLGPFLHQPARKLSLGQRMKADFAAALLHNPPILFLDEPTIGLDVMAKEAVRNFIKFINRERGATVILTTHDMMDIEAVCDRVMIIDKGSIILDSSISQMRERVTQNRVLSFEFKDSVIAADFASDHNFLKELNVKLSKVEDRHVVIEFNRYDSGVFEIAQKVNRSYPVTDMHTRDVPVENIVRSIYKKGIGEPLEWE